MGICRDLERGKKGEKKVIELFVNNDHHACFNDKSYLRDYWDIEFTLFNHKKSSIVAEGSIEVKNDEYAARSGNLAFEFFNSRSNKESGINITQADIWAQLAFGEIWFASVRRLKEFTQKEKPLRIVYNAGDGNADILLFPKEFVLDNSLFFRVDNLDKKEFLTTILEILKSK